MERNKRRSRPILEGLEGRTLLNATRGQAVHARATTTPATTTPAAITRLDYQAADGGKVRVQLLGPGNLAGSAVGPNGALNLVYSGTSIFSSVVGTVKGGSGHAPLQSIRNASVPLGSLTGVGGELLGQVSLPGFDLVSGGNINLLPGVNALTLNSVAANSQVHLRDTPLNTTLGISTSVNVSQGPGAVNSINSPNGVGTTGATGSSTGTTGGSATGSPATGNSNVTGAGTLSPTITGFGGTGVGAINGKIAMIPTVGNGQNFLGTPGLTQAQVNQGRTSTYATEANGGIRLATIGGTFTPGGNLIEPRDVSKPGGPPPPPGVIVTIKHVNGGPTINAPPLGNANIFGYDATANALIRFDAVTGVALQSIALPASAAGQVGGVALARDGAELVALVGVGRDVLAFDAIFGTPVGQFSTAQVAGQRFGNIGGIGTGEQTTVLVSPSSAANPDGLAQAIDVTASLASGQAVTTGRVFAPGRQFFLGGGITGVAGSGGLFAQGAAHFDTFQPNLVQSGILTIAPAGGTLSESVRSVLTSQGAPIPANPNGTVTNNPSAALGSLESSLALDTGVVNGQNVISLLNPATLAAQGSFVLNDANLLTDLSESFHPELANSALIDVQGNVQSFTARDATGLVLNDAGNLNQLTIGTATNSSVVGLPFGHVTIPVRNNVSILTNSRLVGERGGVTVNPNARQVGPLNLP